MATFSDRWFLVRGDFPRTSVELFDDADLDELVDLIADAAENAGSPHDRDAIRSTLERIPLGESISNDFLPQSWIVRCAAHALDLTPQESR
jgi:hypothetical protein